VILEADFPSFLRAISEECKKEGNMKRGLSRFLSYLLYFAMAAVLVQGAAPPAIAETIEDLKKEMQILKQKIEENKALEERVKTLEKKLEEVEKTTATVKKEEAVTKEKKGSPAFAYWRNGFYLATPDDNFNMRIGGNIHFDTKFYGGNSENPSP
jgi:regulator of replication initiation timing